MDFLLELFYGIITNKVLLAGVLSWTVAQVLKVIIHAIVNKSLDITRLVGDGGMPSGHSATVSAVATMCGLTCGTASPEFAIAAILAIITCHDAMHSRMEIGKQASVLNTLIKDMAKGRPDDEALLQELVGHTPSQVTVGITLGICIGCLFYSLTR
ncbi:MAG: divergent PAP2 family protein [bacterium]